MSKYKYVQLTKPEQWFNFILKVNKDTRRKMSFLTLGCLAYMLVLDYQAAEQKYRIKKLEEQLNDIRNNKE